MRLGYSLLSITTPVSLLGNEFDVRSLLHGRYQSNLCHSWGYERLQKSNGSLKDWLENVNIVKYKHTDLVFVMVLTLMFIQWSLSVQKGKAMKEYSKSFKISNTFLFLISNEMFDIRAGILIILVRMAYREDHDLGLLWLSRPFWQTTSVRNWPKFTVIYRNFFFFRQQREELTRKKEKMESMLKGKKNTTGVARPESPGSRRRRSLRRTTMPTRRLASSSRSNVEVS